MTGASLSVQTLQPAAHIEGEPEIQPELTLSISALSGCPTIDDDATATFDGQAMTLVHAGGSLAELDGTTCQDIAFELADPTVEASGTLSILEITDGSATWTIEAPELMTRDLVLAAPPRPGDSALITWDSAPVISSAFVELSIDGRTQLVWQGRPDFADPGLTIEDRSVQIAIPALLTGTGFLSIDADRSATATRCDGPRSCTLRVETGADFPVTISGS